MPDVSLKIQKSQVHFYPNQNIAEPDETPVYKDVLQLGVKSTLPAHSDLPTYGIRVEVDVGVPITCAMIQAELQAKVEVFMEQRDRDIVARNQLGNCPGVTEDGDWFYATVSV